MHTPAPLAAGVSSILVPSVARLTRRMRLPSAPFSLALLLSPSLLWAQASPSCPMQPKTVAAMRHCYRPLLVFSPSGRDSRMRQQEQSMDNDADDMMDRNVLLLPLLASTVGYQPPLDAPSDLLPSAEQQKLRRHYGIPDDRFRVILLGEDGTAKLTSDEPIPTARLNALIDTMPTRKLEMQEPNTN